MAFNLTHGKSGLKRGPACDVLTATVVACFERDGSLLRPDRDSTCMLWVRQRQREREREKRFTSFAQPQV